MRGLFELERAGFLQTSDLPQTRCPKFVYFGILLILSETEEIDNIIRMTDIALYSQIIFPNPFRYRQSNLRCTISNEMRCWWRMEKIGWPDRVRNEEVLQSVKEERNILQTIERKKANWIGHILRRNCLLKHVIKLMIAGRTELMVR